jgi:hypothetical protein
MPQAGRIRRKRRFPAASARQPHPRLWCLPDGKNEFEQQVSSFAFQQRCSLLLEQSKLSQFNPRATGVVSPGRALLYSARPLHDPLQVGFTDSKVESV